MFQFSYLPFFPTPRGKEFDAKVGKVHLFNFWKFKDSYINDLAVRRKMESLCEMYVDEQGKPCHSMTIAVIDNNYSFSPLSEDQLKELRKYVLSLLFCSIVKNEQNAAWASEHFNLYHQNFDLAQNWISYETGSYVRLTQTIEIAKGRIFQPECIANGSWSYGYDERLFPALANAIEDKGNCNQALFRSLDWVRLAFSNSETTSWANRLVMLCIAFEVFFELPEQKENEFAARLEDLLEVAQMESPRLPIISKKNKRGKPAKNNYDNTMYGWWARDFYWVRSEIVHKGELPEPEYRNQNQAPHHELALKMLHFCFYRELEKRGYLKYKVKPEYGDGRDIDRLLTLSEFREIEELIK